jgi:hypothetical protein
MRTPSKLRLTNRDLAILRGLFESRIMTAGHIATLHFEGRREAAKKRLQKLKAAGLIGERKRNVNEPSVLFLTRKAFCLLRAEGVLSEYPPISLPTLERRAQVGKFTIRHELEVMDVKAAFHTALTHLDANTLAEFSTWPLLHQFEARRSGHTRSGVLVKPDGFIRIHEKEKDGGVSEHAFFLEVDRSSETLNTLVNRAACYVEYYKSGGFAIRHGATASAFKEYPFRILMIFKTAERRNNIAERLLEHNPPIFTQAYLSTLEEVTKDPLGAIWIRPIDYRDTRGGNIAQKGPRPKVYRRQAELHKIIEKEIKKVRLLEGEAEEK